ncbi:hypothetical protein [Lactobacillus ultunensis]|uniref:OsmC-like protein n=1 Tax=Lactobacillus ultunensis DSM 16047 TaxID=525365 RepID=C2ER65_9LACO|nr:hypothetical protein [Lactobacillus ultunensis]EEJ70954.1 hypothetical protein HMPREF0548_2161 [Lactobacillus ultunensis DSM 16047]KRL79742.1 hypothetical protein FC57_GL001902 [Lactobacillus ultunensis DSM 16047]QQP28977.1 hypothetical protein H4B44_02445 [Lactobacillus ultunensis]
MTISTFGVSVHTTENKGEYLARARNFQIPFVAGSSDKKNKGITSIEGILVALASCETIVTSDFYKKQKWPFNNFYLAPTFLDNKLQVKFHLNKHYYWAFDDIKQAIVDGSPVYDNIVRAIPIGINQSKENENDRQNIENS